MQVVQQHTEAILTINDNVSTLLREIRQGNIGIQQVVGTSRLLATMSNSGVVNTDASSRRNTLYTVMLIDVQTNEHRLRVSYLLIINCII